MQNVQFKHTFKASNVLLYDIDNNYLRAAFLAEEKPKEGDLFQTFTRADTNFVYTFRIMNVISVSDSQANAVRNLVKKKKKGFINVIGRDENVFTKNALIEADIEMLNVIEDNGVVSGELKDGIEVESSIREFYKKTDHEDTK